MDAGRRCTNVFGRGASGACVIPWLAAASLLGAGCMCGGRADAGVDAGVDADTGPRPDAPWEPAFEPRILWSDPTVTCTPVSYTYDVSPPRPPVAAGDLRWVYRPGADPDFGALWGMLFPRGSGFPIYWGPGNFLVTASGGVIARFSDRMEIELDATGALRYLYRVTPQRGDATWFPGYQKRAMRLFDTAPFSLLWDAYEGGGAGGWIPADALPAGPVFPVDVPAEGLTRVQRAVPAVMADGSVVWAASSGAIAVACLSDQRLRMLIEHDAPPFGVARFEPQIFAPRSGGFVFVWGEVYRFDPDGALLARARAIERGPDRFPVAIRSVGMSEACGLGLARARRLEWWDIETLAPTRSIDWPAGSPTAAQVTPDCGIVQPRLRGIETYQIVRTEADGAWRYWVPSPVAHPYVSWPLEDGGILYLEIPSAAVLNADGTLRWMRTYPVGLLGNNLSTGLSPDGVFYFGTSSTLDGDFEIAAVEVGARPAFPNFHPGLDWANSNASWPFAP